LIFHVVFKLSGGKVFQRALEAVRAGDLCWTQKSLELTRHGRRAKLKLAIDFKKSYTHRSNIIIIRIDDMVRVFIPLQGGWPFAKRGLNSNNGDSVSIMRTACISFVMNTNPGGQRQ
jgi:hypothetical protein